MDGFDLLISNDSSGFQVNKKLIWKKNWKLF